MKVGSSPRTVSSRRRITYRRSAWRVHQFEVWGGELVCRAAALRMQDSLLLWLGGGGGGERELGEVAVGVPARAGCEALASTLLGAGGAAALARRLVAALARPVFVCGAALDRGALPLAERALAAEIRRRPDCF